MFVNANEAKCAEPKSGQKLPPSALNRRSASCEIKKKVDQVLVKELVQHDKFNFLLLFTCFRPSPFPPPTGASSVLLFLHTFGHSIKFMIRFVSVTHRGSHFAAINFSRAIKTVQKNFSLPKEKNVLLYLIFFELVEKQRSIRPIFNLSNYSKLKTERKNKSARKVSKLSGLKKKKTTRRELERPNQEKGYSIINLINYQFKIIKKFPLKNPPLNKINYKNMNESSKIFN